MEGQPPAPVSLDTPATPAPRSAARVGVLLLAGVVLAGGAVAAALLMSGASTPAVVAYVPPSADGFLVVNWKLVRDDPGFQTLWNLVRMRLLRRGKARRIWERSRIDPSKLEGAVLATRHRGRRDDYLLAVRGAFEHRAVEDTLREEGKMTPIDVGGTRMFARGRPRVLAGFERPEVFVYGSEALVRETVSRAGSRAPTAKSDPALSPLLSRVSRDALFHGAMRLPPDVSRKLRRRGVPAPGALAGSFGGGDGGVRLKLAAGFESPAAAERARSSIERFVGRGLDKLRRARFLPPRMLRLAESLARGLRLATAGAVLDVSAALRLKGGPLGALGILGAVAVPSFVKYVRRSKTTEAVLNLERLFHSARSYYQTERVDGKGTMLPRAFPASVGPTPPGSPCGRPGNRYAPDPKAWEHPTWKALGFALADPHYYRYTFSSRGSGRDATFVVRAEGDLDCDGVWSTFEKRGRVDAAGRVRGSRLRRRRALE